jgi:hypothetical protein
VTAFTALAGLPLDEAEFAADAARLLYDAEDQVRLAAARALADRGRRESLAELEKLLGSPQLEVRVEADRTLRALTGQQFGFTAYEAEEQREAARRRWQAWIASDGPTAGLHFPLRTVAYELGRTLVCNYTESKVYEYDARGEKVWESTVGPQPWCCQGLPNGHRLVGTYNDQQVTEYDERGKEVWKAGGLPGGPTSVSRLDNGHTLIACTDSQRVVEVDHAGKIVWNITVDGRPVQAQRLGDGRTLVVLQNGGKVVEVDRQGKVLWELSAPENPFSAQRLENGNTLVSMMTSGEVREFDRNKTVVWKYGGLTNPYDVQRTSSGTTLIVDNAGVVEVDAASKVVWRLTMSGVSRAYRF